MFQVVKTDSGTYTCDIENEYGSTKATIKVLVIGQLPTRSSFFFSRHGQFNNLLWVLI